MTVFDTTLPPLLEQQLSEVLRRYRRLRALRAAARFFLLLLPLAGVLAGAVALGAPPLAVLGIALLAALGAAAFCFVPLLARGTTLREIAAHIDRHHPELQDRILSAVVLTEAGQPVPSPWMLEHFLAETQRSAKGIPLDSFISPRELRWLSAGVAVCGALVVAGGLAAIWNLGYVRSAFLSDDPEMRAVTFSVEPGDVTVLPGDNQIIWVTSPDTHATRYLFWESGGVAQSAVMAASSTPDVAFHTFQALQDDLRYQVRVGEVVSDWYTIHVSRPPGVNSIQLQYDYPEYLGMAPKVVPFGGDIAAVEGTRVTVRAEANKPLQSATLVLDSGEELPLAPLGSGLWEAAFVPAVSGSYHLALLDEDGEGNPIPEEFTIEVQPDKPPAIRVRFPRGDSEVLALEEVPVAFEVEDDFGIVGYGIEYAVAGREPVRLALNSGEALSQELAGAHLLALEEMGVTGGDLITWSVWAADNKPDRETFEISGDPFFLEVRPYVRRYREQITSGGGGAESGEGGQDVLELQRAVVIALHNLRKQVAGLGEDAYNENAGRIRDSQQDARKMLEENLGQATPEQAAIGAEALQAMEAVATAIAASQWPTPEAGLGDAMASAQRALQLLLKLAPDLRTVTRSEGGGGGGGGGASQGEIDELEMAKRTGYEEEARTGADEAAANEELRKSLDDLARRQEMLNDDLGKLLSEDDKAMEEAERRRQLERLREEQARQLERLDALANEMAQRPMEAEQRQAARDAMQEARRNMETSMESVREERLQEARAAGSRAAQQLEAAESGLDSLTREAARDRMAALEEELDGIREQHEAIQRESEALAAALDAPGVAGEQDTSARQEALKDSKQALARAAEDMLTGAGGLSDQLRENQELLSRKLGDWTRRTSRTGVVGEMEESVPWVDWGAWEMVRDSENQVQRKLDIAAETLEALERYMPGSPDDDMARALDLLNDLGLDEPQDGESDTPGDQAGANAPVDEAMAGRRPGDGAADPKAEQSEAEEGQPGANGAPGQPQGAPAEESEAVADSRPGSTAEGQEGAQPGEGQEGSQPGEGQPGPGGGDSSGDGEQLAANAGENSPNPEGQPEPGAETPAPGGRGGPESAASATGGGGERSLEEFFGRDASEWRPALRDAASLLPRESDVRGNLEAVEMEIGRLQREYNKNQQLPDVAEFEQVVRRPLMDSIATLEEIVRARAEGERQWLEDEGEVPAQYVDRVAEYFRLLAEAPLEP